jgi:hypothetical protein
VSEIYDAVMSIRLDAAGVDGIPMSFIKLLLPVVLLVLTHIFNHIFVSSEFEVEDFCGAADPKGR